MHRVLSGLEKLTDAAYGLHIFRQERSADGAERVLRGVFWLSLELFRCEEW